MNIRPSAAIRQNYNEIAEMCRKTAEPVFLTKNGEGDLVVMDIETFRVNTMSSYQSRRRRCLFPTPLFWRRSAQKQRKG